MTAPAGRIDRDSLRGRLILMLAALVTASVLAVGFSASAAFNRAVEPELANRTRLIGTIIRAEITVEISPLFVQTRLRDVFLDVLVLALIATLVALELALAVTISSVGKPLDRVFRLLAEQRAGGAAYAIVELAGRARRA